MRAHRQQRCSGCNAGLRPLTPAMRGALFLADGGLDGACAHAVAADAVLCEVVRAVARQLQGQGARRGNAGQTQPLAVAACGVGCGTCRPSAHPPARWHPSWYCTSRSWAVRGTTRWSPATRSKRRLQPATERQREGTNKCVTWVWAACSMADWHPALARPGRPARTLSACLLHVRQRGFRQQRVALDVDRRGPVPVVSGRVLHGVEDKQRSVVDEHCRQAGGRMHWGAGSACQRHQQGMPFQPQPDRPLPHPVLSAHRG